MAVARAFTAFRKGLLAGGVVKRGLVAMRDVTIAGGVPEVDRSYSDDRSVRAWTSICEQVGGEARLELFLFHAPHLPHENSSTRAWAKLLTQFDMHKRRAAELSRSLVKVVVIVRHTREIGPTENRFLITLYALQCMRPAVWYGFPGARST